MTALPETIKEPAKLWESTLKPMNASDEITGKLQKFNPSKFLDSQKILSPKNV